MRKSDLDRARVALAAGRHRRALSLGWQASAQAVSHNDREMIEQVAILAESIARSASVATAAKATQLERYCRVCVDSAVDDLGGSSEIARLLRRARTTRGRGPG
jgi:hypothetical protein